MSSIMETSTVERLHNAVCRNRIMWTELADRVMKNENISREIAAEEVAALLEKRYVALPVAIALIDMIVERKVI